MRHHSRAGTQNGHKGAISKSGMINEVKVKLFYDMFVFLSLYYGSDNKVIIKLDLKDKFIKYKMINRHNKV